jgi:hypothetical protein
MPSRNTARPIARASIWSDFPGSRSPRREAPISFGATRTTRSPAARSACSRWWERSRQSSIAHTISPSSSCASAALPDAPRLWRGSLARLVAAWCSRRRPRGRRCSCGCLLRSRSSSTSFQSNGSRLVGPLADRPCFGQIATLPSGHAIGPGTATDDTTGVGQTKQRPTNRLRVSPPPAQDPTRRTGQHHKQNGIFLPASAGLPAVRDRNQPGGSHARRKHRLRV